MNSLLEDLIQLHSTICPDSDQHDHNLDCYESGVRAAQNAYEALMERQVQELKDLKSDIRKLSEEKNQTTQSLTLQQRRAEDYYSRYKDQIPEKIRLEAVINWYKDREAAWQSHAKFVDSKLNDQTKKMDSQEEEIEVLRAGIYNGWDGHAAVTTTTMPSQPVNAITLSAPQYSYYAQNDMDYEPEQPDDEGTYPDRTDSALAWYGGSDIGVRTSRMSFLFYVNLQCLLSGRHIKLCSWCRFRIRTRTSSKSSKCCSTMDRTNASCLK